MGRNGLEAFKISAKMRFSKETFVLLGSDFF
jgi:hypothetical protein